jgi:thioredoxin-like negative regulator of GroEL
METIWKPQSKAIYADEISAITATRSLVLLHCWAHWNRHDCVFDTALQELQSRHKGQFALFSFDTTPEEGWERLRQWQVLNLPALVCFINGKWYETLLGAYPTSGLEAKLQEWLNCCELD